MTGVSHVSALQLAEARLPGLPATESAVIRRARTENWSSIPRPGRGGGRLYAVADLPAAAREALLPKAPIAPSRPVGRPAGTDYFTRHPDVAAAVEAVLSERRLAAPRVLELLATRFALLPSRRSLQRFIAGLEASKPALLASARDPDLYRGRHRVALGRADGGVSRAHEMWEIDTTKADVHLAEGRMMVLGLIDRWSRLARFLVVPSESGQSVRRLLVGAMADWNVTPEEVATDNGAGFINASLKTALPALGVAHRVCPPGSPWKKPFVERLFGTFTRERAELLGGYSGHSVGEAQRLRAAAKHRTGRAAIAPEMTAAELQAVLDAWVAGVYHQREHGTTRHAPLVRARATPAPPRAAPGPDALRTALSALVGPRTVGKKGIVWRGGSYWSPQLPAFVGRTVLVRRDEDDLGALFVFDEDGRFVDTAVNHERAGLSEERFARWAQETQAEWMNRARAELRAKARDFSFERARDAVLRQDAEAAGKLVELFPGQRAPHSTPTIDSLAEPPAPPRPDEAAIAAALARTAPAPKQPARTVDEKVAEADALIAAARRGEPVEERRLSAARLYADSPEYRTAKMLHAEFGAPQPAAAPFTPRQEIAR